MGENTAIAWCDHTFNTWFGCSRVSPGCQKCYAETFSARIGHGKSLPQIWGVDAERKPMSEEYWKQPLRWNRAAEKSGVRKRVFCSSMADVFEILPERNARGRAVQDAARARLWPLIVATPWLDWLLLTKRPENVATLAPWRSAWPANVWLGTTVEDQRRADERVSELLDVPARVRFVSAEPLLERVDLFKCWTCGGSGASRGMSMVCQDCDGAGRSSDWGSRRDCVGGKFPALDWVIVGGESGPGARPFDLAWARSIVEQCGDAGVACFFKQAGSNPHDSARSIVGGWAPGDPEPNTRLTLRDRKGGDPLEWPEGLRVQQWPEVSR